MKVLVLCALIALIGSTSAYDPKYDQIDLFNILHNNRLLNVYVSCLLEGIKCTNEGDFLKKTLPDAIQHNCKSCTDRQRIGAFRGIEYLMRERGDVWRKISNEFDKDHKFITDNQRQLRYCQIHKDDFNADEFLRIFPR